MEEENIAVAHGRKRGQKFTKMEAKKARLAGHAYVNRQGHHVPARKTTGPD
jgi:hypothetical protein